MTTKKALAQEPTGPLSGVKIVDLTSVLNGSYATQILADQGADVIKVEPPNGDNLRQYPSTLDGENRAFLGVNRSKRGVILDLKSDGDRRTFLTLAQEADVLVHNFRPGVPERLKIDFASLRKRAAAASPELSRGRIFSAMSRSRRASRAR